MGKKYSSLSVTVPRRSDPCYANFVNSKDGFGNIADPSKLEKALPGGWEADGEVRFFGRVTSVCYCFPRHLDGLNPEEVSDLSVQLMHLGAQGFSFMSYPKNRDKDNSND